MRISSEDGRAVTGAILWIGIELDVVMNLLVVNLNVWSIPAGTLDVCGSSSRQIDWGRCRVR